MTRSDDPDDLIVRLRRNATWAMVLLAVGTGAVTWELGAVLGVVLAGVLVIANFHLMTAVVDGVLRQSPTAPSYGKLAFLAIRLVLLALLLCAIVLLPGVDPIPVALGLSVLVLAVLIEAFSHILRG